MSKEIEVVDIETKKVEETKQNTQVIVNHGMIICK